MQVTRRRLLRAGLAAGAFSVAGIAGRANLAQAPSAPRFSASPTPVPPEWVARHATQTGLYRPQISELLVRCCDLAGEQYHRSKADSSYDGNIQSLSEYRNYSTQLSQYRQIKSFRLPQLRLSQNLSQHWARLSAVVSGQTKALGAARAPSVALGLDSVLWGYALTSSTSNIIALRGTQTEAEMATGASVIQVGFGARGSRVHAGFYLIYQGLIAQLRQAVEQFDPDLPCYITGYSLGGAIAVLAAATLAEGELRNQLQVYTYAMPRVGNPAFAEYYNRLIPRTYRIVNQADLVPTLPPDSIQGATYADVGEPWFYFSQCGSFDRNHAISTYRRAVDQGVQPEPQGQDDRACS